MQGLVFNPWRFCVTVRSRSGSCYTYLCQHKTVAAVRQYVREFFPTYDIISINHIDGDFGTSC